MISDVEQGKIGIVVMKDMTRWGRNRRSKEKKPEHIVGHITKNTESKTLKSAESMKN
jgi:hypothetical protein